MTTPRAERRDAGEADDERRVPDVRLHEERADDDQPWQHRVVALRHRPREQHVAEEWQHRDPRIPRVDEQVDAVTLQEQQEHDGERGHERQAAAPPRNEHAASDDRAVQQSDADEHTGVAEQPVERCRPPEEQRSRVIPAEP